MPEGRVRFMPKYEIRDNHRRGSRKAGVREQSAHRSACPYGIVRDQYYARVSYQRRKHDFGAKLGIYIYLSIDEADVLDTLLKPFPKPPQSIPA